MDKNTLQECWAYISRVRVARYLKVMKRQKVNLTDFGLNTGVATQTSKVAVLAVKSMIILVATQTLTAIGMLQHPIQQQH